MSSTRREFVDRAAALGAALALPNAWWRPALRPAPKPLRVLFSGAPASSAHGQAGGIRGHTVTLFNRGPTAPGMWPGIETLIGDRDGKLEALEGREWDAVVDNSGDLPVTCATRVRGRHARLGRAGVDQGARVDSEGLRVERGGSRAALPLRAGSNRERPGAPARAAGVTFRLAGELRLSEPLQVRHGADRPVDALRFGVTQGGLFGPPEVRERAVGETGAVGP